MENSLQLTGNLKMKTNNIGWFEQWKLYTFLLGNNILTKMQNTQILSVYDLKDSKVVDFEKFSGKKNSFAIFLVDGTSLCFIAENLIEKQRWMFQIENLHVKASFHNFQEALNVACISSDLEGKIISVNHKATKVFLYEKVFSLI